MFRRASITCILLAVLYIVFDESFTMFVIKLHVTVSDDMIGHVDHELLCQKDFFKESFILNQKRANMVEPCLSMFVE